MNFDKNGYVRELYTIEEVQLSSRRAFKANVVVHDAFEGPPGGRRLREVDGVGSPAQARARHVEPERPVQTMDPVPRDGVVVAETACRREWLPAWVIDPDLQKVQIKDNIMEID